MESSHTDRVSFGKDEATEQNAFRVESENCKRTKPSRKANQATATELKALLEKQQYRCAISGLPLTPDTAALDHIMPVSEGGTHTIENLQWLHTEVNRMKGSLSQKRFEQLISLMHCEIAGPN